MPYPAATAEQIACYREHGWLVVADAIAAADLDALEARCDEIIRDRHRLARDWAWDAGESRENRSFRIVQAFPHKLWPELMEAPYRTWAVAFGSALMGGPFRFHYDQFLAKPAGKSAPTFWHQDEAYWGRAMSDRGVTCWMPMQDVDATNGCMHFIDRGHREGVHEHRRVGGMRSDILTCDVGENRIVVCPIRRGSVTFHHSKMPHMTTPNSSKAWRKALTQHMWAVGADAGGHYPWYIEVEQIEDPRATA